MSRRMFGRPRLLQVFGCVLFTVFKSSGVPPTAPAAESLPSMQQGIPQSGTSDWGDHLFHDTFTHSHGSLSVFVLGALLHPATLPRQQNAIQQLQCPIGLVRQRRNIPTFSCRVDGNCGWHSLLNGNCRFLGQVYAPLLFIHCPQHYSLGPVSVNVS